MIRENNKRGIKRGDLYFIRGNYNVIGSEMKGVRPAVVVSNNMNNSFSDVLQVVYLTSKFKKDEPTHVKIRTGADNSVSTALCEQVHSVSKKRIIRFLGKINTDEMKKIDESLKFSLGL